MDSIIERTITEFRDDTLTSLGSYAFSCCTVLTAVELPAAETIGTCAFSSCTALTILALPKCTSFMHCAFENTGLQIIDFWQAITNPIGGQNCQRPFNKCVSLKAIVLRNEDTLSRGDFTYGDLGTPIASGTGYIYVPSALLEDYKAATNWSTYADQFRALEDYTVDGTTTGELRLYADSLTLSASELTFADETAQTLTTNLLGVLDTVSWSSSDPTVAAVSNGVVTPVSDGTCTITCTCGDYSATCQVTVDTGGALEFTNILEGIGYNAGYLSNNGAATTTSANDTYTDRFVVQHLAGQTLDIRLLDVTNTATNSRICYYDQDGSCVGYTLGTAADYGVSIPSTVPETAAYGAISVNISGGFTAIEIYCDDTLVGYSEYTS